MCTSNDARRRSNHSEFPGEDGDADVLLGVLTPLLLLLDNLDSVEEKPSLSSTLYNGCLRFGMAIDEDILIVAAFVNVRDAACILYERMWTCVGVCELKSRN